MTRRRLSIALALLGVVVLTVGTGGFSTADVDRSVQISVVDDENALLGVDRNNQSLSNGVNETVRLLVVRNQFDDGSLTVSNVRVTGDDSPQPPTARKVSVTSTAVDATKAIAADVTCASNENARNDWNNTDVFTVRFTVSSSGGDITVRLSRDVRITCTGDPASGTSNPTSDAGRGE